MEYRKKAVKFGPTRGFIFLLSLGLLGWGLFVLNPGVNTFGGDNFYDVLESMAPEVVWGALFTVAGLGMAWSCFKRNIKWIARSSMAGFALWAFLSLAYGMSDPTVTPIVTNAVLALAHAHAWMSVKLYPEVITNKAIWNDDEVVALAELADWRKEQLINKLSEKECD